MQKVLLLLLVIFTIPLLSNENDFTKAEVEKRKKFMTKANKINTNRPILRLDTKGHMDTMRDIIVTKDKKIITASNDKTIRVWDSNTGKEERKILGEMGEKGFEGMIRAIALSPDEKYLVVAGFMGSAKYQTDQDIGGIKVYEYATGKLMRVLKSHKNSVYDLAFSADGNYLISGSWDKSAKIWSVKTFELLGTIKAHKRGVSATKIIQKKDGYYALTAGYDGLIALHRFDEKSITEKVAYSFAPIRIVNLALSNKHIAISGLEEGIGVYDHNLTPLKLFKTEQIAAEFAYSPNGKYFFVETHLPPNSLKVYEIDNDSYHPLYSLNNRVGMINQMAFLDNTKVITSSVADFSIRVWNIVTKQHELDIQSDGLSICSVGIKGDTIAWGNGDESKNCYQATSKKFDSSIDLKSMHINATPTKEGFKKIETTYGDYSLHGSDATPSQRKRSILEIRKNNSVVATIKRNSGNGVSHSAYGFYKNLIVSGGIAGHLRLYDLRGKEVASLVGHKGIITSLAVDGDRLVSGSSDQTIRVWNLKNILTYDEIRTKQLTLYFDARKELFAKMDAARAKYSDEQKFIDDFRDEFIKVEKKKYAYTPILYPTINLFTSTDNQHIVWTDEGYFTSSQKGMEYIYFHINQGYEKEAKVIKLNQLYDHFFRPDLVKLIVDKQDITSYTKGLTFKTALQNPPPNLIFRSIDGKEIQKQKSQYAKLSTNQRKVNLSFDVNQSDSGGVGLIRIYHEGKLIKTIGSGKVNKVIANKDILAKEKAAEFASKVLEEAHRKEHNATNGTTILVSRNSKGRDGNLSIPTLEPITTNNQEGRYSVSVELRSGSNEISIEAFNKTNTVTSYRQSISIDANISKNEPTLYVLSAGVNNFEYANVSNLNYSQNDANAIIKLAQNEMKGIYSKVEVVPLLGKALTKRNLIKQIKAIQTKAKVEDTVLFYISTHGEVSLEKELYLVPYNSENEEEWIGFDEVFKEIQAIKALNQVFIIDACQSGKASDMISSIYDSRASVLAKSTGVHLLLATTKGTSAFEHPDKDIHHGVFTYKILQALKQQSTDSNQNGTISIKELSKVLLEPRNNTQYQHPIIRNIGRDIELIQLKEKK
jgi:WD40 repeat protein